MFRTLASLATLALAGTALGESVSVSYDGPTLDRWMYPFNPTPGTRITASTFGSTGGDPEFENRDAIMIVGFDTDADVAPGQGAGAYAVTSAVLRVTVANDLIAFYDPTSDPYQSFLPPEDPDWIPDEDLGEALELFGTGYRNGWSLQTFMENSPWSDIPGLGQQIRNAYCLGYDDLGDPIDVSLNVQERYDPKVWAVGQIAGLTPGELIPQGSVVEFVIDVDDPFIQQYLAESLDAGRLNLTLTSLTRVQVMGGSFPLFFCKEHPNVIFNFVDAAQLDLEVTIGAACVGDVDGSGAIDFGDVLQVLSGWGPCSPTACTADLDDSGTVDFNDLLLVLSAWGPCP